MATVSHVFVSAIADDPAAAAAGQVLPSHWNAAHTVSVNKTDVGLSNVTDDAQTKAAIVPNTAPAAGELLVGNGTAYANQALSGDAALSSAGALTLATVNSNVGSFTNANITVDAKGRVTAAANGTGGGATAPLTLAGGTVTADAPPLTLTQTWNNSGVTFTGYLVNITNTASAAASKLLDLQVGGTSMFAVKKDGELYLNTNLITSNGSAGELKFNTQNIAGRCSHRLSYDGKTVIQSGGLYGISSNSTDASIGTIDVALARKAISVAGLTNGGTGGAGLQFTEMTAPAAPAANNVILYAEDDGSGKTRLMARFATGAAVQLAIEP